MFRYIFYWISFTIRSEDTRIPWLIFDSIYLPKGEPDLTSSLSKSPVDKWINPYFLTKTAHCLILKEKCTFPFQILVHPKQKSIELELVAQHYTKKVFLLTLCKHLNGFLLHLLLYSYLCFRNLWQLVLFNFQRFQAFFYWFRDYHQIFRFVFLFTWFFQPKLQLDNRNKSNF